MQQGHYRLLSEEEIALIRSIYIQLDKYYNIRVENDTIIPIDKLELGKEYSRLDLREIFQILDGSGKTFVAIMDLEYYVPVRYGGYFDELQIWGFTFLSRNYGHILIKPETFKDWFVDLLQPLEINFPDDEEFCTQCYVLANDKELAIQILQQNFRDEVKKILLNDYYIEILNNLLIIGNKKGITNNDLLGLSGFIYNISQLNY